MPSKKQLINDLHDAETDADMHREYAQGKERELEALQGICDNQFANLTRLQADRADRNIMAEAPFQRTPDILNVMATINGSLRFQAQLDTEAYALLAWLKDVVMPQTEGMDKNGCGIDIVLSIKTMQGREVR